jgi:alpha-L-rhamnosidase
MSAYENSGQNIVSDTMNMSFGRMKRLATFSTIALLPLTGVVQAGTMSDVIPWTSIPVHAALTPDGRVMTFGATPGDKQGGFDYVLWDPNKGLDSNSRLQLPNGVDFNSFCVGGIIDPATGKIVLAGGGGDTTTVASASHSVAYDYLTAKLYKSSDLHFPRYYASLTTLPDGRLLINGGASPYGTQTTASAPAEIYTSGKGWTTLTGTDGSPQKAGDPFAMGSSFNYPHQFPVGNNELFVIAGKYTYRLGYNGQGSWRDVQNMTKSNWGKSSTALMYRPGLVMQIGGGAEDIYVDRTGSNLVTIYDMRAAISDPSKPVTARDQNMRQKRHHANATVLANGEVLVSGGSEGNNRLVNVANRMEIYNPATDKWRLDAATKRPRLYHSVALLLKDGRVLIGGGGLPGPVAGRDVEIYTPDYLLDKNGKPAARPSIIAGPTAALSLGQTFRITADRPIKRVTILKTGVVTHNYNTDQRFFEATFTSSGNYADVVFPNDAVNATPGVYMVFVFDADGVASVGKFVRLKSPTADSAFGLPNDLPTSAAATGSAVPSSGWAFCANEGEICPVEGTQQVRYGANGSFKTLTVTGQTKCSNEAFGGDPVPNVAKTCEISASSYGTRTTYDPAKATASSTGTATGTNSGTGTGTGTSSSNGTSSGTATGTWVDCAVEGGTCQVTGTQQVRYGINGTYSIMSITTSVPCTNEAFGKDPVYGVVKSCAFFKPDSTTATLTGWSACAVEGETCKVSGTQQVRYGVNGSYRILGVNGQIACTNSAFGGDPALGKTKTCEVLSTFSSTASSSAFPSIPDFNPSQQVNDLVPAQANVCPVRIVSTSGAITNPAGLLCNGGGNAVFTLSGTNGTARIVLDYGREVGGLPFFNVGAVSGSATLKASYAETMRHMSDNGDGSPPPVLPWGTGEGDPSRTNSYEVTKAGIISNYYTQGGQRYQAITLTGSGSVTLNGVGITYIADRTLPSEYGGYFNSSDDVLNRIWYASAYTAQLGSVPVRSLPGGLRVMSGVLDARGVSGLTGGSDIGYYKPGLGWTDYTVSFQANIVNAQAGWAVRAQSAQDGLVFLLDTSSQLRVFTATRNAYKQVASAKVPFGISAGQWYDISTTVQGSTASVSINGKKLLDVSTAAFGSGSVGFRQYQGERALFRKLVVSNGAALNLPFDKASDLASFAIPGSNEIAGILDGAKRDRLIWSGDIDIAGPTLAYTLGNNEYLKGSLIQMASRQHTSGFVEGVVPATYPGIPATNLTSETGAYSSTYSMYFVLGAYDHLMFTGDRDFARTLWPAVQKQMAWNATRLDSRGLFVSRKGDGADWDFYDPEKEGTITAYNALYYRALLNAATIGETLGQASAAADYRSRAARLANAINTYMYDSGKGYYKVSDTVGAVAQDANSIAVFANLAPADQVPRILAGMKQTLWTTKFGPLPFNDPFWKPTVSTFISAYEAQARYAANDAANAETLLRTVFGWMVNSANPDRTGTMWENIATDGTPGLGAYTSLAHGWATGAVSSLSGYALGVRPTSPGFNTWLVQPHPGTLSWANGRVPTPHGAITAKWARQTNGFALQVIVPSGTLGQISVPTNGASGFDVTLDGAYVWRKGVALSTPSAAKLEGQFLTLSNIGPGTHQVLLSQ